MLAATGPSAVQAASPSPASQPPPSVRSAGERRTVDLTVYNSNLALVREERVFPLAKGTNRVVVPDIPATIDPTSVHFGSLTDEASVRVLEQNYQYDLVNRNKLLEKYLGRTVEFIRRNPADDKDQAVPGRLLAVGAGNVSPFQGGEHPVNAGLIAEIGGKVEVDPAGRLVLPSLPEGLVLKPQLEWRLSSTRDGEQRAEISYLARSMSWTCDYVALLDKNDGRLDLKGWVTLSNQSGTTFKDAGLKLVAGDVNQVQDREEGYLHRTQFAKAAAAPPQFEQKELFEYKLYTLQRRTDVKDNESKQIELVTGKDVPARKQLIYDGMEEGWRYWINNVSYRSQGSMGQQGNTKVGVYLVFRNDPKSGLGMPLPKGKVRVYKKDDDGREQFIGEDLLDHTPKDEEIRLYMGNAFDVVGSRAQTDFRTVVSGHSVEETFQIKVRNHKKEAVEVAVYEHPWRWSQWELVKSSAPGEKVDQTTLKFPLKLAPDQEKILTYTVRYTW